MFLGKSLPTNFTNHSGVSSSVAKGNDKNVKTLGDKLREMVLVRRSNAVPCDAFDAKAHLRME